MVKKNSDLRSSTKRRPKQAIPQTRDEADRFKPYLDCTADVKKDVARELFSACKIIRRMAGESTASLCARYVHYLQLADDDEWECLSLRTQQWVNQYVHKMNVRAKK